MDKILYTRADGGVSIVIPAPGVSVQKAIERSVPEDATNVRTIKDSDIPTSREFRDAWALHNAKISVCCERAKEIQLKRLRAARDKELQRTDIEYIAAMSKGQDATSIVLKKAQLREITDGLKGLDVAGKVGDEATLARIRTLGSLQVLEEQ